MLSCSVCPSQKLMLPDWNRHSPSVQSGCNMTTYLIYLRVAAPMPLFRQTSLDTVDPAPRAFPHPRSQYNRRTDSYQWIAYLQFHPCSAPALPIRSLQGATDNLMAASILH